MGYRVLIFATTRRCSARGHGDSIGLNRGLGTFIWTPRRQKSSTSSGSFRQSVQIPGITIVHDEASAERALRELRRLKERVHAWDTEATEVGGIAHGDLRSPVTHGRVVCATCFCGEDADFGNGPRLLVDNDGPAAELLEKKFKAYFEDSTFKKVFHNYSFDRHLLAKEGLRVRGYHADTLHMARFLDTSLASWEGRAQQTIAKKKHKEMQPKLGSPTSIQSHFVMVRNATLGGVPLEQKSWGAGTSMLHTSVLEQPDAVVLGYGLKNLTRFFGLVDADQQDFRELFGVSSEAAKDAHNSEETFPKWAKYATDDAVLTYRLFDYLHAELSKRSWHSHVHRRSIVNLLRDKRVAQDLARKGNGVYSAQNETGQSMWEFFEVYMRDFGECLADLEEVGIGVDCSQLQRIERDAAKHAEEHQANFVQSLNKAKGPDGLALVADANFINIRSSKQIQSLLFGGIGENRKTGEVLAAKKSFPVPKKHHGEMSSKTFDLQGIGLSPVRKRSNYTASGNPKAAGHVLQEFAGACAERPGLAYEQLVKKGATPEEAELVSDAVRSLKQAKQTMTLVGGFARPMMEYGKTSGRIHPQWKFDTATGRLACRKPNLQNLPSAGRDAYSIRSAFKASTGNTLLIADYSQLEMRVLAHMSNSQLMIKKLTKGGDYHSEVTAEMFGHVADAVARQEVSADDSDGISSGLPTIKEKFKDERQKAKAINFAIVYGKEAVSIAEDLHITKEEAEDLIDAWYKSKPEVKKWKREVVEQCSRSGSALSLLGRVRTLPLLQEREYRSKSERAAVNFVIQGSAADVVMAAMLRIWKNQKMEELGFTLVLQVHDEFVLEGPEANSSEAAELLQELMMNPFGDHQPKFQFRVPLSSDVSIRNSFGEA